MAFQFKIVATFLVLTLAAVYASDPSQLQDFCVAVADAKAAVFVNGKICKAANLVTAEDFSFKGLNKPGIITNAVKSNVTTVNVIQIPGLNTLGISMVRIDYGIYGQNPPHTHPRASEILLVTQGTLLVGFVTSNPSKLISKVLNVGDVFVFPEGLIHFQFNVGKTPAVAIASLSSQNPGVITIANAVFGVANDEAAVKILSGAFQVDAAVIKALQAPFFKK